MNKSTILSALMLASVATAAPAQTASQSHLEKLDRGVVAVPSASGKGYFVSWRLLGTDDDATSFDIIRDGVVLKRNLFDVTSYDDDSNSAFATSEYRVVTKHRGVAIDTTEAITPWSNIYLSLPLDRPDGGTTPSGGSYTYSPNDCSVGDVDGDGQYEIIVKWDPSNSQDNSKSGYTGNVYIDCYKLDGTKLWRIDLGVNIRAGAHYTQFLVYDFDGDGKAEMICKTATGSKDGAGDFVNQAATDSTIIKESNSRDWRNSDGKVTGGQEYLTVFNGETGKAIHTIFYNPNRGMTVGGAASWANWGGSNKTDTSYGNRGERYLAAVAYLDGLDQLPSAVMTRGYYTNAFLWAVDFDGKELTTKWLHNSSSTTKYSVTDAEGKTTSYTPGAPTGRSSGSRTAYGNGNHNLSVADVDGDGKDEIVWGACAVDDDGKLIYATGYGHGDAMHLSDLIPDRPGLELFTVHEEGNYGWDLHDAATGEIIRSATGDADNGRGLSADVDPDNRGFEFWSSNDRSVRSAASGSIVSSSNPSVNFRAYWNGDLYDEVLDGNKMDEWNGDGFDRIKPIDNKDFYDIANSSTCNSTKNTPNLLADIIGDWREELILWDSSNSSTLNIFTTNVETEYRVPTLMHDHVYRMGIAWQNAAYNQPPHLGYFLPDAFNTRYAKFGEGDWEQTVTLGDSITPITYHWVNSGSANLVASTAPDGTSKTGTSPVSGFSFSRSSFGADIQKTFTLEGAPTMEGDYTFVIQSGQNVIDKSTRKDTIVIHCVGATNIKTVDNAGEWVSLASNVIGNSLTLKFSLNEPTQVNVALVNGASVIVAGGSYTASDNTITLDNLGHVSNGIYFLKVQSPKGKKSWKIIKQQ